MADSKKRFPCEIPERFRNEWSIEGDELLQNPRRSDVPLIFGDPNWTDYDISLDAKPVEDDGLRIFFRYQDDQNCHSYDVGSFNNKWQMINVMERGKWGDRLAQGPLMLPKGEWRHIEVKVRGTKGRCLIDGRSVLDEFTMCHAKGRVGLLVYPRGAFRIRNIVVEDPNGRILLEGLPDLDHASEPTNAIPMKVEPNKAAKSEGTTKSTGATGPIPVAGPLKDWVPLFNGKDLTGWKTHPSQTGNWRVENGVLIGSGQATSHLYSDRGSFTNLHLRVEARINDGGNSGVSCRSTFGPVLPANNPRWPEGYEAQINSTGPDKNKTGSLYGPGVKAAVPVIDSNVRPNEWFTLELIAADSHLVVKINGQTTAEWSDPAQLFPMGHIALQQHDPQTVIEFRKIEINEVRVDAQSMSPSTKRGGHEVQTRGSASPATEARFACEIPLYARGLWSVEGDELVQKSCDRGGAFRPNMPAVCMFFGDRNWSDYDFSFDAKPVDGSDLRAHFRFQDELNNHSYVIGAADNTRQIVDIMDGGRFGNRLAEAPLTLVKGNWRSVEVKVRGSKGTCFLDGQKVLQEFNIDRHATGCVGFSIAKADSFRFRNIIVKDPNGKVLLEGLPDLEHAARPSFPGDASLARDRKIVRPTERTDLLGLVHLPDDALIGNWRRTEQGIQSDTTSGAKLQFRCRPAGEYDLQLTFSRIEGNEWMALALCHHDARFSWWLGSHKNKCCGIASVNGWFSASNSTKFWRDPMFENARKYTVLVKIRDDSISTYVDGMQVGQDLETDYSNIGGGLDASIAPNLLAIYTASPFILHEALLIPFGNTTPADRAAGASNPRASRKKTSHIACSFKNETPSEVAFSLGNKSYRLGSQKTREFTGNFSSNTTPVVRIRQRDGGQLEYTVTDRGQYTFRLDAASGKIVNHYR